MSESFIVRLINSLHTIRRLRDYSLGDSVKMKIVSLIKKKGYVLETDRDSFHYFLVICY